ncbi:MAG TPA: hypothetical protein VKT49_00025 [Bryobacteraceae bacterium]|nr:hypothetical protein [Bryobacteraceae bacterium]
MLSGKLIRLIETHQQEITDRLIRDMSRHPELTHLRQFPEAELRERSRSLLENLGYWLAQGNEEEIARKWEAIGRARFDEDVPLQESVHALFLIKEKMIDYIGEQGFPPDTLELYAEEELERRVGRFFDLLVLRLIRGYEGALRTALHATA